MTTDEMQEMDRLCLAIQLEPDPTKFIQLVQELNAFFERHPLTLPYPSRKSDS